VKFATKDAVCLKSYPGSTISILKLPNTH